MSRDARLATDAYQPLVDWLLGEGKRLTEPVALVTALGERLNAAGVDISRITTGVPILNPQIDSSSALWVRGRGASERLFVLDQSGVARLRNSPMASIYQGGRAVRWRADRPATPHYAIYDDLRAEGATDYLALPVPFADGTTNAVTFATPRPDGLSTAEVALLERLVPALAPVLEIQALRRTAQTLLATYVGAVTGGRVLAGQIKRGMGETIRAVIWLCDLRGFTPLSERLPRDALILMLNDYFGAMCRAVEAEGGEVLKFIGDAMLAIFPLAESDDAAPSCRGALAAAARAAAAVAEINTARGDAGQPPIDYGIALHLGDVMYGNIGGERRLDFTVIGPAVNLIARIEALAGQLDRRLLLSADFASACPEPLECLGAFALKGLGQPQAIFVPSGQPHRPRPTPVPP